MKRATWLTLPLLLATGIVLHLRPDESLPLVEIPLKEVKPLVRAIQFIEKNYVDPQAIDPFRMVERATQELERAIPPLLIQRGEKKMGVRMGEKEILLPVPNPMTLADIPPILGRLLGFLDLFYEGRLEEKERLSLALGGLVETLDPHSNYLPPKIYNEFKIGTKGNFGGLGIVIGIREGELTVIAPLEGTPAYEAGIKAKDKIVQIGEEATINMGLTEAVERLRGPVGTRVSLMITRAGIAVPLKFTLTRANIRIHSAGGKALGKIVLVKIKNFQEDTFDEFKRTLRRLQAETGGIEGLILDLRNNPGGLLDQAVVLADFFLKEGLIVKTVGAHGETLEAEEAGTGDDGEELPLVVLVNEGSASASEIIAGALLFNERALVLGNRTFGKGSVQTVYDLKDGSALKLTIAKYLTAKDQPVQSIGINPDVGLLPATIDEKMVDLFEDLKRRGAELDEEEERPPLTPPPHLPPPSFQMTYLGSERKEEEETGKIEMQDDFPVRLAGKILELTGASLNRQDALKILPPLLEALKKEEAEKIRQAFSKMDVDWSEEKAEDRPAGAVSVELLDEKEAPRRALSAGESGFLRVTVENQGGGPFSQLMGISKSEDPLFANLEFPLGKVLPGSKRSWKTPLKMPDLIQRRSVPVEIEFRERYDRAPKPVSLTMQIDEPPTPLFQYRYSLLDNGTRGTKGNGNRLPERGETIGLLIKVKNVGKGESRSPVINLKNLEGEEDFIEKGRVELTPLPPSREAEGLLLLRIARKGEAKRLSFDLSLLDSHLGSELTDRLVLPLTPEEMPTPPPETVQAPPLLILSPDPPPLTSRGGSYTLKGRATDDEKIKQITLFVGNQKVLYQSAGKDEKSLPFTATAPLKKGFNLITLLAQDERELTTRRQWIVWRGR